MTRLDQANAARLSAKYDKRNELKASINSASVDRTGTERNILLNDLILLIDLNYYHWEKLLYNKKAGFDLGTDAAILSLGGATALVGTTAVANVLGQITTGITDFKTNQPRVKSLRFA